ncbi:hypothetical protein PAHAL_1G458200 [Panicum hallii]|uniref:OB domain-containing protein n=1 Tax=Panicum hallii TaxID=206008 RepID=A0A2T8KYJ3_9POAL|nr:hypothetical protein PAHAL_1G458200 [Panicum hallii]
MELSSSTKAAAAAASGPRLSAHVGGGNGGSKDSFPAPFSRQASLTLRSLGLGLRSAPSPTRRCCLRPTSPNPNPIPPTTKEGTSPPRMPPPTPPSKMRGASSTMPLTVKQIADAQQSGTGDKGAPFVVDGVETANIRLVGMVNGKVERNTDVSFTLDDGTGRLDFIRWVNDASDSSETAAIYLSRNDMYVSVIGSLKGLQERKRATAF